MFEKKKKNKAHKPTWPPKPTSSHFPFLPHHTRSLLKGVLIKFTWEPYFGYGLHILNTYPHYIGSFGALSEFFHAVDCIACFSCDVLDYFSIGALNERSVDSNLGVGAAWDYIFADYYYFLVFLLVFSLKIIFSSFLFS
jgi:hypothetical protein